MTSIPFLSADFYAETIYSIKIAEGLFFKLNPEEGFSNFPSGYLHPFIYALLYFLSFKNKDLFIVYTYIFNTLIFILTIFVIKNFYRKFFMEKSNIPVILLILSVPFTFNFYLTLNFPLYTLFFYLSLYFLDKKKFFILFYLFLVLTRPEGIILFPFYILYKFYKDKRFDNIFFILTLILISLFPFLINKILTGYFTTLALRAQSIFFNYEFKSALITGFKTFFKHLAAIFLGFPILNIKISEYLSSIIYPPLFLFFVIFYLFKEKNFLITFLFILFLLILFLDSFTIFTGIHFSRHIAYFYPALILFFYKGLKYIRNFLPYFYFIYFLFSFFPFLSTLKIDLETSKTFKINALKAGSLIPDKSEVLLYSDPYFFFYNIDRLKINFLSPSFNPICAKKIENFIDKDKLERKYIYVINTYYSNAEYYYDTKERLILKKLIDSIFTDTLYREKNFILLKRKN
ncbi:MAG: hypothetical protein ABIN21_03915 [candidate division WOR-3 bacterium]